MGATLKQQEQVNKCRLKSKISHPLLRDQNFFYNHWQLVPLIYYPGLPELHHTERLLGQETVTVPAVSSSW